MITSATLKTSFADGGSDWDGAVARSGADALGVTPRLSGFDSPFDYAAQAEVLIVTDVPKGDVAALAAISLIADDLVNDFLGVPQDAAWLRHGAQALDYLGFDEDELSESKTDILDELQEAQAYRS